MDGWRGRRREEEQEAGRRSPARDAHSAFRRSARYLHICRLSTLHYLASHLSWRTDSSELDCVAAGRRGAGTIPSRRPRANLAGESGSLASDHPQVWRRASGGAAAAQRPKKQATGSVMRTDTPSAGTPRFARELKAAMPKTRDGTPTKALLALKATDVTVPPSGSAAEALGHNDLPRGTAQRKSESIDGSWTSCTTPASAAIHESRWNHSDVDYSADPRTRHVIATEVKVARKASDWRAATHAVTSEARQSLAKQSAEAKATVARKSAGVGIAMVFDHSESPSTGVSLAQRYSASRQHEVEMHTAVASSGGVRGLLHPQARAHASAARRTGAERVRQIEERKQTSARAADWGRDATRGNAIGRAGWIMGDRSAERPAQPAASRKNASSPGFCLS
jgi:hypothetical protein